MADERVGPPLLGDERAMLRGFLDYQRATLAMKCEGLDDEQIRRRSVPPSALSLLSLVRHMAEVERTWFRMTMAGEDVTLVWSPVNDYQVAYDTTGAGMSEAFGAWQAEVERSRKIEASIPSLDTLARQPRWDTDVSLRFVMLHVFYDYARHNGHADLLREAIDGTVGA